jgi:ubiquinone/menaquinone biosynthesis C-methylase UbiE
MPQTFKKDLSHLSWEEIYARQEGRAALVGPWMAALGLEPGDRVLEIGSGPGFVSLMLADRVGPAGVVYAVDRSAAALAYLSRLQEERGVANIERLVADAATLDLGERRADAALVSMVLHHADDPGGIIRNVTRLLSPGALVLIAEFHPDGPCEQGPPHAYRLAPDQIRAWCEAAGLSTLDERRQTPEHYMVLAKRMS